MSRHVVDEWFEENSWSCTFCEKAGIPGDTRKCTGCGRFKDHKTVDVIPDGTREKAVIGVKLDRAQAKPDVICCYCQSQTHRMDRLCRNCGNPWEQTQGEPLETEYKTAPEIEDSYSGNRIGPGKFAVWIIVGALIIMVGAFLLYPREKHTTVTAASWIYTSTITHRVVVHGEGWDPPGNAYNKTCYTKFRRYEPCHPHDCNPHSERYQCGSHSCNSHSQSYSCHPHDCSCSNSCTSQKNGYSKCRRSCDTCYDTCSRTVSDTCPDYCNRIRYDTCYDQCSVNDSWCSYDHDEWPVLEAPQTTGDSTQTPTWPSRQPAGADERMTRTEEYSTAFTDIKDPTQTWRLSPSTLTEWQKYPLKSAWVISVSAVGITPIHPDAK